MFVVFLGDVLAELRGLFDVVVDERKADPIHEPARKQRDLGVHVGNANVPCFVRPKVLEIVIALIEVHSFKPISSLRHLNSIVVLTGVH